MIKKILGSIALLCFSTGLFAQSESYKSVLTINSGASLPGGLAKVLNDRNLSEFEFDFDEYTNLAGNFDGTSTPAIQINYDHGIKKWFSVGGGISYQRVGFDITDLSYFDEAANEQTSVASVSVDINRINFGVRALFHYGNNNRLDMYSGIRVGLTSWGIKADATDTVFEEDISDLKAFGVNPAIQIIPFALRGYVTENLGLNFELGLGAPHYLSVGLNYRL